MMLNTHFMPASCSFVIVFLICESCGESTREMKPFPAETVPPLGTKILGNLHEFLKAGARQCCARCRTRRAQTLPPMQPTRKAKQSMPRWRQESGDGARVPIDAVAEACDG